MNFNDNLGPIINDNSYFESQLCRHRSKLNVGHMNIQSFKLGNSYSKIDELKNVLCNGAFSVLGLTETWLKESAPSSVISFPGYNLYRNDRPNCRGGGVAFYVSKRIKTKIVHMSSNYGSAESLFVEINSFGRKILLGVVYIPHGVRNNFHIFENDISDLLVRYSDIVIMGDFNANMFNVSSACHMREMFSRLNLVCHHNSLPTHICVNSGNTSLIDYFLLSSSLSVCLSGQVQIPGISRHSLIFVSLDINFQRSEEYIEYYDYNNVNMPLLRDICDSCNFDALFRISDVNEQANVLYNSLCCMHSVVPLRKFKIVNVRDNSWINSDDVRYSLSVRDVAYRYFISCRTENSWRVFCRLRNRAKTVMRNAKRRAHAEIFRGKSSKQIWSTLFSNGLGDSDANIDDVDVEELNHYFALNQGHSSPGCFFPYDSNGGGFSFRAVGIDELSDALLSVRSNSVGCDGISIKFLKLVFPIVGEFILHFINSIITMSTFPAGWKLGRVVPIKKTGNSVEMDNLRPISILPTLSKVVEILLKNQLIVHIDAHSLLSDSQYGFRCGRNTTSLLLGLTDKIRQSVSNGGVSLLLSLDLKKAFDKVDHGILIEKLYRNFNISMTACKLIASFLADRSQYVSVGSRISSILPVRSGVPQGSVLGPLLFDMYINDIFGCINFTSCVSFAYADDLLFLLSGERQFADVLQQMINYCVSNISDWMWNNKLFVNVQKTKVMFFGSGVMDFIVDIDGMQVEFVDKIYCLGIWLDNKLTFERHINYIISKVNYSLRRLYSVNLILPMHIKLMVVHSLIMPIFLYGIEVYSGTIGIYMRKLRILFNRVVRYLYCLRIRNSVSSYVSDFLGCSFYSFVKLRTFLFFYKAWKGGHLLFLMSFFKFGRSRRNCQILIPKLTSILERSFHVRVAHMFNALPNCLKTFEFSYCVYEKRILKHIQENGI